MGGVESLDRIARDAVHASLRECRRKFLRQGDEHVDASIEQQSVDQCVWIAAVDGPDGRADAVEQARGRR